MRSSSSAPSSMGSNSTNKKKSTAVSSNKKQTVSGILSLDRPVMISLLCLLVVYYTVAVVTYVKVSQAPTSSNNNNNQNVLVHNVDLPTLPTATRRTTGQTLDKFNKQGSDEAIRVLQKESFPLQTNPHEYEEIQHPGFASLPPASKLNWPTDLPQTMRVPKFFDQEYGWVYQNAIVQDDTITNTMSNVPVDSVGYIRRFLGSGQRLPTPQQAAQIGSTITTLSTATTENIIVETIYCSVASYRDPECTGSVIDLYERAEYPQRIRVAILDQRVPNSDDPVCAAIPVDCVPNDSRILCRYGHLIDRYEMDARFAVGPVFARHLAHRFYRGEYFAMQIDSHVRFIEHWDTDVVKQWKSANNEMNVLATYLSDINGSIDPVTHKSTHPARPIMCQSDYEGQGHYQHLRHGQQPEGIPGIRNQPTLHPFWAAGFSFARGHFVIQVPYDQYLPMVFQGEEISIGLRGFTYGYDYYTPERGVCFHMYAIKENAERRKKIPLFWEHANMYAGLGMKSMKRLNTIIEMANYPTNEWTTDEQEKYGLGTIRTTRKFFDTFGIHTESRTVEKHLCRFVGRPMMRTFLPALRSNRMGLDYDQINYRFVDPDKDNADTKRKRIEQARALVVNKQKQ